MNNPLCLLPLKNSLLHYSQWCVCASMEMCAFGVNLFTHPNRSTTAKLEKAFLVFSVWVCARVCACGSVGMLCLIFYLSCPSRHEAIHSSHTAWGQHTHRHTYPSTHPAIAHGYIFGPRKLFLLFNLLVWVDFTHCLWHNITHTHTHIRTYARTHARTYAHTHTCMYSKRCRNTCVAVWMFPSVVMPQ